MSSVICKQHPVDIEPIFCLRILEENYISANYNLRKNNTIALKVDFIEQDLFDTYLEEIIDLSLREDIGEGDHTSLSTIPDNAERKAVLLVKDNGIIAGIDLAKIIFNKVDPLLKMDCLMHDGDQVQEGDFAFFVTGPAQSILTAERLVLNFMQRLSGIATQTNILSRQVGKFGVKLLDTRKTTPGLRLLEKWAVKVGGGTNHRIGLFDMILIKDNHIDYAGGVTQAVKNVQEYLKKKKLDLKIEVELRSFADIEEALKLDCIDRVLLDNFSPEDLRKAVVLIDGKVETEASGGIHEGNILAYAKTGVDYISSGALTHTVKPLDLSLKIT
ncbi:MAG: carboxylating nicotinate-nucleotide diphosphorylase [Bacteroidetes bacterium]|nr:carboxylating nicotinate-nucleotide diphosphorylase [Bacteroidota bacterium]MBT3800734.1 carboxylating nicotinate-nucleotide diphosphorylase [Bacteroidota bacterium]MBT5530113.1 carboxylating nicotinate-nucleotide diphosphorylase [Cytophagia bacterium]MBT5992697.1 carboxylating nicotinate-nucleotide diphosphorylase [Bacteroidota bacterium]MBT7995038.1 carboxylating nicotinate-nucleotide diphosphorylase [Bacteroidota bacterium]